MLYLILFCIILCIFMSLKGLFFPSETREHQLSMRNFLYLGLCYVTIMLGFGLVFLLLEMEGFHILKENDQLVDGDYADHFFTSMYFSGITLFSVGYGDVTPIGIGRGIALVEAWLGYTIPAAFVVKSIFLNDQSEKTL